MYHKGGGDKAFIVSPLFHYFEYYLAETWKLTALSPYSI